MIYECVFYYYYYTIFFVIFITFFFLLRVSQTPVQGPIVSWWLPRARARAYCAAAGWTSPGTERQFKWIMDIYGPSLGGWVSRCYFAGQSIGRRPRRRGGYFCMRGRHGPRRGFRGLRSRGFGAEYARCKYVNYYAFERVAIIDDRFGFWAEREAHACGLTTMRFYFSYTYICIGTSVSSCLRRITGLFSRWRIAFNGQ